jgi:voltage-gated potassium channel
MYSRAKRRAYEIVERADEDDRTSRIFDTVIVSLIGLNLLAMALETLAPLRERAGGAFDNFETVSVAIFIAEYFVRVWSCTEHPAYTHPIRGRLRFAVSPLVLVDLVAILPFFIPMFVQLDLRFARTLRLFRLFRLIKLSRYSESMAIIGSALRSRREVLLSTVFVAFILLFIVSSMMYLAERDAQPELFSSIPAAMWWGMVTLTTVGYGDVVPVTALGRVFGAIVALLGIGLFALPAGILGSAFVDEIERRRLTPQTASICPHCGKPVNEHTATDP